MKSSVALLPHLSGLEEGNRYFSPTVSGSHRQVSPHELQLQEATMAKISLSAASLAELMFAALTGCRSSARKLISSDEARELTAYRQIKRLNGGVDLTRS